MVNRKYLTKLGDTWDVVSLLMYDSELFVDELIQANWHLRDVAMFSAGISLTIPPIAAERRNVADLPPWRRTSD